MNNPMLDYLEDIEEMSLTSPQIEHVNVAARMAAAAAAANSADSADGGEQKVKEEEEGQPGGEEAAASNCDSPENCEKKRSKTNGQQGGKSAIESRKKSMKLFEGSNEARSEPVESALQPVISCWSE